MARKGGASLQLEDPFTTWSDGPLRYDQLTPELRQLVQPGSGLIDLNIVNRNGARPTAKMTGGELNLAVASAAAFSGRMGAYAIGTIPAADQAALPSAMAGAAQTTDTGIVTPWTVTVHAPPAGPDTSVTVDGIPWPSAGGTAIVPAGEHRIVWSELPGARSGTYRLHRGAVERLHQPNYHDPRLQFPRRHLRGRHPARRRRSSSTEPPRQPTPSPTHRRVDSRAYPRAHTG